MTHDEYESHIKITSDEAFDNVASGEWDKEQFYDWYTANVMEAQANGANAEYYTNTPINLEEISFE